MVSNDKRSFDDHFGRLLSTPNNENWSRVNTNQKKTKFDRLREYPSHRYDLPDFSCVNQETQVMNRKLR